MNEVSKKDWKLYREKIGQWQEAYMGRLLQEYIAYLQTDASPSEKFWTLENKIQEDKRTPGVRIELSKRDMPFDLVRLNREGIITFEDLSDFSQELQEDVKFLMDRFRN